MENWRAFLNERGIGTETISSFALHGDDHRVILPYTDLYGRKVTEKWRWLDGDQKYGCPPGSSHRIYNVRDLHKAPLYVAEGEFDTIILSQAGYNAVGIPGSQAFKKAWVWGFCDAEVTIFGDGDKAGAAFVAELESLLAPVAASIRTGVCPPGKDINDLYLEGELEPWMRSFPRS